MSKTIFLCSFVLSLLIFGQNNIFAEISVSVNDTTVKTDIFLLPVNGSTIEFKDDTVTYSFLLQETDYQLIEVIPNKNLNIKTEDFKFNIDYNQGLLKVTSTKFPSNFNGKLFDLNLRLFPKVDFYTVNKNRLKITPTTVSINKKNGSDSIIKLEEKPAYITIDTVFLRQTFKEGVSFNYPNPFYYETNVFFSILEKTTLKIYVHSYQGGLIQTIPVDIVGDKALNYKFYNSANELLQVKEGYEFAKGIYKLVLNPNAFVMPIGQYRLLFETKNSKNSINISFVN